MKWIRCEGALIQFALKKVQQHCRLYHYKVAALAFTESGKFITYGVNRKDTHGLSSTRTLHAEEDLINKLRKLKAKNRFRKITVVVACFSLGGRVCLAQPCMVCDEQLTTFGIDHLYFTDELGRLAKGITKDAQQ